MKVKQIEINWKSNLSIFASESFLKNVSDEYGWLGGFNDADQLRCMLPYTIIKKAILRLVRFRVETIPISSDLSIEEEKSFLNNIVEFFQSNGSDVIIPASNNTIFRTFPNGAYAAPYGSYVIDLNQPEEVLWKNIKRQFRQGINSAKNMGVNVKYANKCVKKSYLLIRSTFQRSKLPFMDYSSFKNFIGGLGGNGMILSAEYKGVAQSYAVFAYSEYCAYAIYTGNIHGLQKGANKLLYWEAIRLFKEMGIERFDFFGTRVDPEQGTKQARLGDFKKSFGAYLKVGFMWKYPLNPLKYFLYTAASRIRSGGDIVDEERHKLKDFMLQNQNF